MVMILPCTKQSDGFTCHEPIMHESHMRTCSETHQMTMHDTNCGDAHAGEVHEFTSTHCRANKIMCCARVCEIALKCGFHTHHTVSTKKPILLNKRPGKFNWRTCRKKFVQKGGHLLLTSTTHALSLAVWLPALSKRHSTAPYISVAANTVAASSVICRLLSSCWIYALTKSI